MPMQISRLIRAFAASAVAATAALSGCTTFQTVVTGSGRDALRRRIGAAPGAVGPGGAASGLQPARSAAGGRRCRARCARSPRSSATRGAATAR